MENKMQKAVIDADFFIKLTEYASDNGKIFCQVMDDLGVQPIMHRYVAEVELKRAESLKKLIDEGKITIIDYDEYIDRNDDENYKYYFQCAYERMNCFDFPDEEDIYTYHAIDENLGEIRSIYLARQLNPMMHKVFRNRQKQLKELREQETVKEISENEITTGNLKDDFYYMEGELENDSNKLVYLVPQEIFLKENRKILQRILEMLLLVIGFTVCTMLYFSKRIAKPLVEVAQTLEKAPNGMAVLEEPRGSFKEMSKFVSCYNQAGKKIEELLEKVERESRLKEKAHYEMLMSQISPHFIFNTVNSIRIMAIKEGQDRAGGNENTEKALEALGDILHAVYSNKNGMTTVGQETALLKAYVDIMQMRFGSSFQYYNVIPTELFYYEIPAFTMQPIVENAILHGVKGVTAGQIIVSAIEYENDFVISVFNNGNSADKKKIEDLLKGEKNQRAVTGIGLYNVNSRLKLLYGESYGLIYNEKVRNGFEIWVRLPKKITESEER
jgi:two-component system sensor histidine kinase YesM